jgi:hypothetical protein
MWLNDRDAPDWDEEGERLWFQVDRCGLSIPCRIDAQCLHLTFGPTRCAKSTPSTPLSPGAARFTRLRSARPAVASSSTVLSALRSSFT